MLSAIRQTRVVQKAIGQRIIVPHNNCYSGLLGKDPLYRRMALATGPAFAALDQNATLKEALLNSFAHAGKIDLSPLVAATKFSPCSYADKTFGIYLSGQPGEEADFAEAERALSSLWEGIHRKLFFGTWGMAAPPEIDTLEPHRYAALIRKIAAVGKDPTFSKTGAVRLKDIPFDVIVTEADGSQTLELSRAGLDTQDNMFEFVINENPPPQKNEIRPNWLDRIKSLFRR